MFHGLSAFPLTPLVGGSIDKLSLARLITRLVDAGVDSLGVLGSTGSYAYLETAERKTVLREAISHAKGLPVIAGVSAMRTQTAIGLALDAEDAGAAGLLLAPMSYQTLQEDEVFSLYETVSAAVRTPICVYDNPATTRFTFSDALHGRIAVLPNIASIKIPGVPEGQSAATERVSRLRALIPPHVTIGISGDPMAARGLIAGCDAWYSVVGGLFPELAMKLTHAARNGAADEALHLSDRLSPLWAQFQKHGGSIRVMATAASLLGLCEPDNLPHPLHCLSGVDRTELSDVLGKLDLL